MTEGKQQNSSSLKSAFKSALRPNLSDPGSPPEDSGVHGPRESALGPNRQAKPQSDLERFDTLMGLNVSDANPAKAQDQKKSEGAAPASKHEDSVGFIAALYESRIKPDAIGYDKKGGTSYGVYQIASGVGTFDKFLTHLDKTKPPWAERLRAAGDPNTGSREGKVPEEWKKIASEDVHGFAREQWRFIKQSHYDPALREIKKRTSQDLTDRSRAVKEAVFSTSVQHGPSGAGKLFERGVKKLKDRGAEITDTNLIESVYEARKDQFGGSTQGVQAAVHRRLDDEKRQVMHTMDTGAASPTMNLKP